MRKHQWALPSKEIPSNLHWDLDLGLGLCPRSGWPRPPPGSFSFTATGEPKEEGLEGQISRLAELIGRLESKVGPPHPGLTFLPALSTLELPGKLRCPGGLRVVESQARATVLTVGGQAAESDPRGPSSGCFQERWLQDRRQKAGARWSQGRWSRTDSKQETTDDLIQYGSVEQNQPLQRRSDST